MSDINRTILNENHFIEQYKLYVEMTDRMLARRAQANSFYTSLLTGLIAFPSLFGGQNILDGFKQVSFLGISLLGLLLCFLWAVTIRAYRDLSTSKFQVINEMENLMPFSCYQKEWDILMAVRKGKPYTKLTLIEQYIPLLIAIPYATLLIYSILGLMKKI
jgi:hypothetical protein